MGRTVYLPTFTVYVHGFHVGKYTVRPMGCYGIQGGPLQYRRVSWGL